MKSPRYQIRKKRRKYATGHVGSKQKGKYIEEEIEDEKESKRLKDPKTAKVNFFYMKHTFCFLPGHFLIFVKFDLNVS